MKRMLRCILVLLLLVSAFSGCSLQTLMQTVPEVKYELADGYAIVKEFPDESSVVEITIPDEYEGLPVTEIADFAGVNHTTLTAVYIGKNVEKIGEWAFENNQKLEKFVVNPENEHFCSVDGVLFTKDMKTLLFYPPAKDVKSEKNADGNEVKTSTYVVPNGVEIIRTKAFYKCSLLSGLVLPDSVKSIEEKAFFRCSNLPQITLPDGLTFIGKDAFAYCASLTEITIPASVEKIDDYAFFCCNNLLTVNMGMGEGECETGNKWYPTDIGKNMKDLVINWK